jgi:hypothetical protein
MMKVFSFLSATQWSGVAKIVAPIVVGVISNLLGADTKETIISVVTVLLPALGLSVNAHTESNLTQTVAAIKDDQGKPAVKIMVAPTAPQPLLDLATDTSVPEVVHAASVVAQAPPPKAPYETSRRPS